MVSAATSSPLRTASPQRSETIAAVKVASTWSATAWVTFTPSSWASDLACWVTAAVSWRRCLVRARSSSPDIPACASRNAAPTWSTCSTWPPSRRTNRLTTHAASDGFFSALTGAARSVPFSALACASRAGVKSARGSA